MGRAIAYEWHRARLRSTWLLLLGGSACTLLAGLLWGAKRDLGAMDAYTATVGLPVRLGILLVAAFAAAAFTLEYQHGTIATTRLTLRFPARIVAAKAVITGALGALAGLAMALSGLAGVLLAGGIAKGGTDSVLAHAASATVFGLLSALAGLALGGLLRNTAAAVGLFAVWLLIGETVLASVLDVEPASLPLWGTAQLFTLTPGPPPWRAVTTLVLLVAVGLIGSGVALRRRDA